MTPCTLPLLTSTAVRSLSPAIDQNANQPADMEGILKITKFPRAHLFGLRRDGTGRRVAGASFEEATQGSLCESIRAGQIVDHALRLYATEEVGWLRFVAHFLCFLLRLESAVTAAACT